jgi:hypothetical protein
VIIIQNIYNGSFIHDRFAYKYFRDKVLPIGNIVAFRAPAKVEAEFMIDLEDKLTKDYIYSQDMVHFCWELPLTNLFGGVAFQRLFCSIIGDILGNIIQVPIDIEGDDIFVCKEFIQGGITQLRGKASVSIACKRNGAILCHTGINIVAGKDAPIFAYSTNMTDEQINKFMVDVIKQFYQTTQDIFKATTKTI